MISYDRLRLLIVYSSNRDQIVRIIYQLNRYNLKNTLTGGIAPEITSRMLSVYPRRSSVKMN